jgi:uncharacterized protein YndB with AHSA1/START domain/DNA-binding transcriptional ArsR family regulator
MGEQDDEVFKALGDVSRRTLLDLLFLRDGQSLAKLQMHLPMTRFGVMKHLQILENAGLITARKVGREKLHYLNPVPIQVVYDRWVSKYARPITRTLTGLKNALETPGMADKNSHVFTIYIRTTPEKLWQALTDGELTRQYYDDTRVESTWERGAPYRYVDSQGRLILEGEVLEINPPRRLVTTFRPMWTDEETKHTSKLTYEIEAKGAVCKLTLIHDDLDPVFAAQQGILEGASRILSGLKTLLETGEPLIITA